MATPDISICAPADAVGLARTLVGVEADAACIDGLAPLVDELIETSLTLLSQEKPEDRREVAVGLCRLPCDPSPNSIWRRIEMQLGMPLSAMPAARSALFTQGHVVAALARLAVAPTYIADLAGGRAKLRGHGLEAASETALCRAMVSAQLPDGTVDFHGSGGQPILRVSSFHRVLRFPGLVPEPAAA